MTQPPSPSESTTRAKVRESRGFWLDFAVTLLVFALYASNRIPDVNEPHYWTKAAHFWNPELGRGDIFLESGDVHWAFYGSFGYLTTFLSMPIALALGRWITWISLAFGWTYMLHGLFAKGSTVHSPTDCRGDEGMGGREALTSSWIACLTAPVWLAAMTWGNWAGEWVVGGCESKGIAYALMFAGIGCISRSGADSRSAWNLTWGWFWIGLGAMFHVVTGLWVIATVGLASMLIQLHRNRIRFLAWVRMNALGWLLGLTGFLAGAVPAVQMDVQTGKDAKSQAAVAQVYNRLGHHLSPTRFSETRWRGFFALLATTSAILLITRKAQWAEPRLGNGVCRIQEKPSAIGAENSAILDRTPLWSWMKTAPIRMQWLLVVAQIAFSFAMVGLLIDLIFSFVAPSFAASLLRFYWFRWNEVTWPLVVALISVAIGTGALSLSSQVLTCRLQPTTWRKIIALAIFIASVGILRERLIAQSNEIIPAGEKQSFSLKTDTPEQQREQFSHWIAVCDWIRDHVPNDGLWLTPRRQQSFKWRTQRPELASWKDMPQNASAVVLWNERLQDAYVYDSEKRLQPISEVQLQRLSSKYGFRYVLLDLRVDQQTIPPWKILYPESPEQNPIFVVLEVPTDLNAKPSSTP